jgi:hypothetical protein
MTADQAYLHFALGDAHIGEIQLTGVTDAVFRSEQKRDSPMYSWA